MDFYSSRRSTVLAYQQHQRASKVAAAGSGTGAAAARRSSVSNNKKKVAAGARRWTKSREAEDFRRFATRDRRNAVGQGEDKLSPATLLLPLRKLAPANRVPVLIDYQGLEIIRSSHDYSSIVGAMMGDLASLSLYTNETIDEGEEEENEEEEEEEGRRLMMGADGGVVDEDELVMRMAGLGAWKKEAARRRVAKLWDKAFKSKRVYERVYSFLDTEEMFRHRRVNRAALRQFLANRIQVKVTRHLSSFLRYTASLKNGLPESYRFAIAWLTAESTRRGIGGLPLGCSTDGTVDNEDLQRLGHVIARNLVLGLEELHIVAGQDTEKFGIASFWSECCKAPQGSSLTVLDISGSFLGNELVRSLGDALRSGVFPRLRHLALSRDNLGVPGIRHLAETLVIRSQLPRVDEIKHLDLSRNILEDGLQYLFGIHPSHHDHHTRHHFGPDGVFKSLSHLNLSNSQIDPQDLKSLAQALRKGALRSLLALRLKGNALGDHAVSTLLTALHDSPRGACPSLTELNLANTDCAHLSATQLTRAMRAGGLARLTHLDLSYNLWMDDGMVALTEVLCDGCCPHLAHLLVACNRIKDAGLHALSRCLSTGGATGLITLDVSSNEVGGSVMHLAKVINGGACPLLTSLKLSGNVYDMDVMAKLFSPHVRRRLKLA